MELDAFVETTLTQIISGVRAAQQTAPAQGAAVNPDIRSGPPGRVHRSGTLLQDIEFDAAIMVTESEKSGAGLRVGVAWVSGGVDAGSDSRQSRASRIRFTVPIALPRQDDDGREA